MSQAPDDEEDGNAAIDKIAAMPNLDRFYDRNPNTMSDEDFMELIRVDRQRRAMFIEKKEAKK